MRLRECIAGIADQKKHIKAERYEKNRDTNVKIAERIFWEQMDE